MASESTASSNGSLSPASITVFSLPDELFRFTDSRGRAYTLDLCDCHEAQNEIGAEHDRQLKSSDAPDQFFYLRKFKEWLASRGIPAEGTPGTEHLRLGELDRLWHELRLQFIRKKKGQNDEYESLQRLLTSTGSTLDN